MNYLLDTHAFIWAISEKEKLSSIVKRTIEDQYNNIFVSAITFWEISLKFAIGKLDINGVSPEMLPEIALQSGFQLYRERIMIPAYLIHCDGISKVIKAPKAEYAFCFEPTMVSFWKRFLPENWHSFEVFDIILGKWICGSMRA